MSPAPAPDWRDRTLKAHYQLLATSFALAQDAVEELGTELRDETARARHTRTMGPLGWYAHTIDRAVRHTREAGHVLSSLEYELFGASVDGAPPRP